MPTITNEFGDISVEDSPLAWGDAPSSPSTFPEPIKAGNIDLSKPLPSVRNPDGTSSTVRSISFERDGKEILIPTVIRGRVVTDYDAIAEYDKTGRHLGVFKTVDDANAWAKKIHLDQEAMGPPKPKPQLAHPFYGLKEPAPPVPGTPAAYQAEAVRLGQKASMYGAAEDFLKGVASPVTTSMDAFGQASRGIRSLVGLGDVPISTPEETARGLVGPIERTLTLGGNLGPRASGVLEGALTAGVGLVSSLPEAIPAMAAAHAAPIVGIKVASEFAWEMISSGIELLKAGSEAAKAGDQRQAFSLRTQAVLSIGMGVGIPAGSPAKLVLDKIRTDSRLRRELKKTGLTDEEIAGANDIALDATIPEPSGRPVTAKEPVQAPTALTPTDIQLDASREPVVAQPAPSPESVPAAAAVEAATAVTEPTAKGVAPPEAPAPITPTTTEAKKGQEKVEVPNAIPVKEADALPIRAAPEDRGAVGQEVRPTVEEVAGKQAEAKAAGVAPEKGVIPNAKEVQEKEALKAQEPPAQPAAPPVVPKQPWEMTHEEFWKAEFDAGNKPKPVLYHKEQVAKALKDGKSVPESVLAEYPDLKAKRPKAPREGSKLPWRVPPRSDGRVDILDDIQELGGVKPPSAVFEPGGEYDGFKETFVGAAKLLLNRKASAIDVLMDGLDSDKGYKFNGDVEAFKQAVKSAVDSRDALKRSGGGPEVQREKFWAAATDPKSKIGLEKIEANNLQVGDEVRFKVEGASHEPFTVSDISPDGVITLRDGPKFRSQEIPEGTEIWVKRGSLDTSKRVPQAEGDVSFIPKEDMPPQVLPKPVEKPPTVAIREGKPKLEGQPPPQVRNAVKAALSVLKDAEVELERVKMSLSSFDGPRYMEDVLRNRADEIARARKTLAEFRKRAPDNKVDAEAFIESLGGEPKLELPKQGEKLGPVAQPEVRELTKAEQKLLTELTLKNRNARDAKGEPLTAEERAEYDRLMAAKGQMNLLGESAGQGGVEAQIKALNERAAEIQRQVALTRERAMVSKHRRAELFAEAKQLDEALQEVRDKISALRGEKPPSAQQGDFIGMGGAVTGEFARGQGTPTAMKYKLIDQERQKRGLEPILKPESVSDQVSLDRAMAEIDKNPNLPEQLVLSIIENPRVINDWENHVLLLRKIELRQEYEKSARRAAQAYDDGRMEDVAMESAYTKEWDARLTELETASRLSGSERGRALRSLQVMVNEDFSLASLEMQRRVAKGGAPVTPEERAELIRMADEYKAKSGALEQKLAKSEELKVEAELARVIAEAKVSEAGKAPQFSKGVLDAAERIVQKMERTSERYVKELMSATWAPSPEQIYKASFIAATKIARGVTELAKLTDEMVALIGEKVRPYMNEIWERAKTIHEQEISKEGLDKPTTEKVKRVAKHKQETSDLEADIVDKLRNKLEKNELASITPQVQKLARHFVGQGVEDRTLLVDKIHQVLQTILPRITRRETMDAISGYGNFKPLSKDDISIKLRQIKGELQQEAKIEDIEARIPLQRSGIERPVKEDKWRRLEQQVNEAKRRFGVVVTDPATQLKSALDARKTAMRNQISDLEYQIRTRQKIVREKTAPPTDAELDAMRARRDELKLEFDAIFQKPGLSDAQRLSMAIKSAERNQVYWSERLANARRGFFGFGKEPGPKLTSPELDAIKANIEASKAEVEYLQELYNPKKTPTQIALRAFKTRKIRELADYKDRLAREDYVERKSKPIELDDEAINLKADLQRIKREFSKGQYDAEMASRSPWRKVLGGVGETYHASRELMTSSDLSAVLRQGGFIVLGHPVRAVQAGRDMFRAMKSQEALDRINQRILERPNSKSGLYDRAKLHLADQNGKLSAREEAFMSSWGKKIPGVAMSERAYVTFLNRMRADSFDAMIEAFKKDREPTLEEARAIANYINVATGRGFLGENSGVALNYLFFSPRYVVSRFQMLGGQPLYGGSAKTRVMIAKEYGRFLAGVGVVYALGMAAGGTVGTDPSKSDFGKIQFGKTRVDPLSGLSQVTVLFWNQGKGVSKSFEPLSTGIPRKKPKYGEKTEASSLGRFLRQKLAPWPAAYVNLATGEDVVGRTVTPQDVALGMVTPISFGDIYRAIEEQGVPAGTAFALLSLLGMGVQTYDPRANRK